MVTDVSVTLRKMKRARSLEKLVEVTPRGFSRNPELQDAYEENLLRLMRERIQKIHSPLGALAVHDYFKQMQLYNKVAYEELADKAREVFAAYPFSSGFSVHKN
jgi:hypothetical protein